MNSFLSYINTKANRKKVNWLKTIWINFVIFPFSIATRLPVICYGSVKCRVFRGAIKLPFVKRGIIKIGSDFTGYRRRGTTCFYLFPYSNWIVEGQVKIGQGVSLLIGEKACFHTGADVTIGDNAEIICKIDIQIGEHSEITWDCQMEDYASHPIENLDNKKIKNLYRPIFIGDHCWIGNRTTIQPGTRLPDRVIVSSNSLLNKDYIKMGIKPNTLIGGLPARVLRENVRRDYEHDRFIRKWFFDHPEVKESSYEEMLASN